RTTPTGAAAALRCARAEEVWTLPQGDGACSTRRRTGHVNVGGIDRRVMIRCRDEGSPLRRVPALRGPPGGGQQRDDGAARWRGDGLAPVAADPWVAAPATRGLPTGAAHRPVQPSY